MSLKSRNHLVSVHPINLVECYPNCIVAATVEFPKDFNKTIQYIQEKLRVVVRSGTTIIYPSDPVSFNLLENQFEYFRLNIQNMLVKNDTVILSLTKLSGSGVVYISANDDVK